MSSVRGGLSGAGRPTALEVGDRLINQTGFQERAGQRGPAINEQRPYPAGNQRCEQFARILRGIGRESEHVRTVPSGRTFFELAIVAQNGVVDESEVMYVPRNLAYRCQSR